MHLQTDDLMMIPWLDKGRTKKGTDCWGLVMLVYKEATGKTLPDYDGSAFISEGVSDEIQNQASFGPWEQIGGPETGAVVLIKNHPILVNHTGICLDQDRFVHMMEKFGVSIARVDHPLWRNRIRGYYRYAG